MFLIIFFSILVWFFMIILLSRITGNEENMSRPVYIGLLALYGAFAFILIYAGFTAFIQAIFEENSFSEFLSNFWEYFVDVLF